MMIVQNQKVPPVLLVVFLGLTLACAGIAWLMLQSTNNLRRAIDLEARSTLKSDLTQAIRQFRDAVKDYHTSLQADSYDQQPYQVFRSLASINNVKGVLIFNAQSKVIYPSGEDPLLGDEKRSVRLLQAQNHEFVEQNYEKASALYLNVYKTPADTHEEVEALAALARCAFKAGQKEQSLFYREKLLNVYQNYLEDRPDWSIRYAASAYEFLELSTVLQKQDPGGKKENLLIELRQLLSDQVMNHTSFRRYLYYLDRYNDIVQRLGHDDYSIDSHINHVSWQIKESLMHTSETISDRYVIVKTNQDFALVYENDDILKSIRELLSSYIDPEVYQVDIQLQSKEVNPAKRKQIQLSFSGSDLFLNKYLYVTANISDGNEAQGARGVHYILVGTFLIILLMLSAILFSYYFLGGKGWLRANNKPKSGDTLN